MNNCRSTCLGRNQVRQKPQGRNAVVDLGSADAFQQITLPDDKEEREHVIAKWFQASLLASQSADLRIQKLDPLPQNDHDFKLATDRGDRFLQLTEFAPLSGPYTEASDMLNVGTTADRLTAAIGEKASHYSRSEIIPHTTPSSLWMTCLSWSKMA
jgi:hypothetical protein